MSGLAPLGDGARVLIVGGGPGGTACALALLRGVGAAGKRIEVLILKPKQSAPRHNQCVGVLSPPLRQVLREQLGVELPAELLPRPIAGYALHGDTQCLRLPLDQADDTFASPRAELDTFLLKTAEAAGAQVIQCRAYDVDVGAKCVTLYTDAGCLAGDVLVGAFGLEPTLGLALRRRVGYAAPPYLEAVVTDLYSRDMSAMPVLLDNTIHAFLPRLDALEFGALIPNANHVSIVVAGRHVGSAALEAFLAAPPVRDLLGSHCGAGDQFQAAFPNGLARHAYGDRFVSVGDAAGLVRPFKGKGIYAAAITGIRAARTMLEVGISREAFARYHADCQDLVADVQYGRVVRILALVLAKRFSFDTVLTRARDDPALRRALFLAVSGHGNSRDIFWLGARPRTAAGLLRALVRHAGSPARMPGNDAACSWSTSAN